jgi:hypothetical protein
MTTQSDILQKMKTPIAILNDKIKRYSKWQHQMTFTMTTPSDILKENANCLNK